jgi:nitrogen PTS system EIIA component
MNEYQITFLVEDINASARVAKTLHRLTKKFKSTLCITNITRNRKAELSKSVAMLQVGLVKGDLCQIIVVGIDAELACFVIKNIISEHYRLIGAHINYQFSNQLADRLPELSLPSKTQWHYAKAQTKLTKFECLKGLAQLIYPEHPEELMIAFIKREECSSTCITPGIALPHVMFDGIDHITVAVIVSDTPIDWMSKMGAVQLTIALVIPTKPTHEQIITATNLTRNLLCGQVAERLLMTKNSIDLQALLMYFMSRLLP